MKRTKFHDALDDLESRFSEAANHDCLDTRGKHRNMSMALFRMLALVREACRVDVDVATDIARYIDYFLNSHETAVFLIQENFPDPESRTRYALDLQVTQARRFVEGFLKTKKLDFVFETAVSVPDQVDFGVIREAIQLFDPSKA